MGMIRILSRTTHTKTQVFGRLSDGSDRSEQQITVYAVRIVDHAGSVSELAYDHNPTDDEIYASVPPALRVKPTALADRIDVITEIAHQYLVARQLTELSDYTTLFTLQERNRIATGRDTLLAELKSLI
jgi:hypothetical protein